MFSPGILSQLFYPFSFLLCSHFRARYCQPRRVSVPHISESQLRENSKSTARNTQVSLLYIQSCDGPKWRMEQETLMLFCIIIKKVPQSCRVSRDSCLVILNHFLWFYCNPEPLYFSQILFQTIRHWPKVSFLLIFFRCLAYSSGDLVAKSCLTLATPWTVGCQAPLPMGFSRQEYWSGLPFPSPGDLP